MKTRRPIREGLLSSLDSDGKLLGSKCNDCGQVYFPALDQLCYSCLSESLSSVELSSEGTLYSYATVCVPAGPFKPPYVTGYVELPEGIRIFSQAQKDVSADNLKTGMPVKLQVADLWETEEEQVVAYRFSPV